MRWKPKDQYREQQWFAWYPVEVDGEFVWLEWIVRQRMAANHWESGEYWSYR